MKQLKTDVETVVCSCFSILLDGIYNAVLNYEHSHIRENFNLRQKERTVLGGDNSSLEWNLCNMLGNLVIPSTLVNYTQEMKKRKNNKFDVFVSSSSLICFGPTALKWFF